MLQAAPTRRFKNNAESISWSPAALTFHTRAYPDGQWIHAATASSMATQISDLKVDTSALSGAGVVQTTMARVLSESFTRFTANSEVIAGRGRQFDNIGAGTGKVRPAWSAPWRRPDARPRLRPSRCAQLRVRHQTQGKAWRPARCGPSREPVLRRLPILYSTRSNRFRMIVERGDHQGGESGRVASIRRLAPTNVRGDIHRTGLQREPEKRTEPWRFRMCRQYGRIGRGDRERCCSRDVKTGRAARFSVTMRELQLPLGIIIYLSTGKTIK